MLDKINMYKSQRNELTVLPFNRNIWSEKGKLNQPLPDKYFGMQRPNKHPKIIPKELTQIGASSTG